MFRLIKIQLFSLIFVLCTFGLAHSQSTDDPIIKVKLSTIAGEIYMDLYASKAPITVRNFLKYVDGGHFKGGAFYRVVRTDNQAQNNIKIEVIQGGVGREEDRKMLIDPIPLERTIKTGLKHLDGTLSMARDGPDTASSEFFICIGDQPSLDFGGMRNPDGQGFAAFGQVTKGMDVVRKIQNMNSNPSSPQYLNQPVMFQSLSRE